MHLGINGMEHQDLGVAADGGGHNRVETIFKTLFKQLIDLKIKKQLTDIEARKK